MIVYKKYKPSDIDWIASIPEHWEVKRVKDIFNLVRGKFSHRPRNDERMYDGGTFPFIQTGDVAKSSKYITTYKQVLNEDGIKVSREFKKGTLLMTIAANVGDVSILGYNAYLPDSLVAFFSKQNIDFYYYLFSITKKELDTVKITNTQDNLNLERLNSIFKVCPPLTEQNAIAQYLDTKSQAIDSKINLLTQKANYYKQIRKSIINDAVCQGLNKKVKLKDSGIEWIGKIPEHWEVKRLKDIAKVQTGNTPLMIVKENYAAIGLPWVKPNELFDLTPTFSTSDFISDIGKEQVRIIKKGSIMVCCIGSIGKMGVAGVDLCTNQQINSVSFYKIIPEFGKYLVFISKDEHIRHSTGNVVAILNCENQKRIEFAFPPLKEQIQIAEYLDEKTQKIDSVIDNIITQISTLKELRKTLINDVVTGKIKVS